jgi:hypothetical protein
MLLVGLILGMANRAGEHSVVAGIRVATAARLRVPVVHGEPRVVEVCSLPGVGGVAGQASGGESRCLVVRVGGVVVILLVTAIAVGRQGCVIIVHVAVGTRNFQVRPG